MGALHADHPLTVLHGIGAVRAEAFSRAGIHTLGDLIRRFPRTYENRGRITPLSRALEGAPAAFLLTVASPPRQALIRKNFSLIKFRAFDESATAEIVFFNSPFLKDVFEIGKVFRFYGRITLAKNGAIQLNAPKFEEYKEDEPLPDIVPLYSLPGSISQKLMTSSVSLALSSVLPTLNDPLPEDLRRKYRFPTLSTALREIHRPTSEEALSSALKRTVFEELYSFAIGLALFRHKEKQATIPPLQDDDLSPLISRLSYTLTNAQCRALQDIRNDLLGKGEDKIPPMMRILIGDVGSGKTVVAASAMYLTAKNGYQAVMMVPTEILARQHFADLSPLFESLGIRIALLVGSMKKKEKEAIYRRLTLAHSNADAIDVLIGTHAVLNDQVAPPRLLLTVTDEQHRFGVMQRAALREKNSGSHLLVMSATPIPRTLALTLYGDLDVSKIDELPPGRSPIDTFLIDESYRSRLEGFIRKEIANGGQAYIVCPSIEEESELSTAKTSDPTQAAMRDMPPLKAAVTYAEDLTRVFPDLRIAFLHGQMKSNERDRIMAAFSAGDLDILVSTTVIEVGVNVPNASLMVIENAERFGLSQLHQLRGRVGRGHRKSYCILISDMKGGTAEARLKTLCREHDGYKIAEADLAQRGPGDFFASASGDLLRQSGGFSLRVAHLCDDGELMHAAFEDAKKTLAGDPLLEKEEHLALSRHIRELFTAQENTLS